MLRTEIKTKNGQRAVTFEDLRGLRAEGYVRDSTLDQRDGFGPLSAGFLPFAGRKFRPILLCIIRAGDYNERNISFIWFIRVKRMLREIPAETRAVPSVRARQ